MKTLPPLTAVLCLLVLHLSGSRTRADDAPTPPPPVRLDLPAKPVWLGNRGVNIDQARARYRERYAVAVHWEVEQNLAAYEKIGKKDPRWDEAVRETLRNSSNFASDEPGSTGVWDTQKTACARALASGCDDPLVGFLKLRTRNYPAGISEDKLAQLCTEVETALAASGYSPLRKFYAAYTTVQQDMICRRGRDGKIGRGEEGETIPAASWPPNTDVRTAFQHGLTQWKTLLEDPAVPPMLYYSVTKGFLEMASRDPIGRAEVLEPLEEYFTNGGPTTQTPAVAKMYEGRFWSVYAWDARGIHGDLTMSEDQTTRFYGRMEKSRAALAKAWELDPTEPEVARNMISVSGDLKKEWSEIDRWLRRAMDTKPNSYDAALAYLRFLGPNWGGTEKEMVDFGRKCFASQDAVSRLPLVLLDVRWRMATRYSDDEAAYWRRADVWSDLHQLFDFLMKTRPDVPGYRTDYAIYAWRAGDWPVAHEQFELVGDNPDRGELHYFKYSLQQYQNMRREAADGVKGKL